MRYAKSQFDNALVDATKILDVRVPRGNGGLFQDLVDYGERLEIEVRVLEYP